MDYVANYERHCLHQPSAFQRVFMGLLTKRAQAVGQKSHKIWAMKYMLDTYFQGRSGLRVLDCGALDGWFLSYDVPQVAQRIALDIETYYAPQLMREGIQFVAADMETGAFPFAENSMDLLAMLSTIEHLDHPFHLASEMARILKPGGILYITVPDVLRYGFRFWDDATHKTPYNAARLKHLFEMHGFETLEASPYNHNLFIAGNLFPKSVQRRMMRFRGNAVFYVARKVTP